MTAAESTHISFLRRCATGALFFIGAVLALVNFVQLLRGETGTVLHVVLGCALAVLLLLASYEAFAGGVPRWRRATGRATLGLTLVAAAISGLVTRHRWLRYDAPIAPTTDVQRVLVTRLDGPSQEERFRLTEAVLRALRKALPSSKCEVAFVPTQILESTGGTAEARRLGAEHKARIVIWGYYSASNNTRTTICWERIEPPPEMPDLPADLFERGRQFRLADYESGRAQFDVSHELTYVVAFAVGMAQYGVGSWINASQQFAIALRQTDRPNTLPLHVIYLFQGNALFYTGDFVGALQSYDHAAKEGEDYYVEALTNRAVARASHALSTTREEAALDSKLRLASEELTTAIEYEPRAANAHFNLGFLLLFQQDYEGAERHLTTAHEIRPSDAQITFELANVYLDTRRLDEAIHWLTQATELDPQYVLAYCNRGMAYALRSNIRRIAGLAKEAAVDLDSSIADSTYALRYMERSPERARILTNRGNAYQTRKRGRDIILAREDYNEAIALDATYAKALLARGLLNLDERRVEDARYDFEQVIRISPESEVAQEAREVLEEMQP